MLYMMSYIFLTSLLNLLMKPSTISILLSIEIMMMSIWLMMMLNLKSSLISSLTLLVLMVIESSLGLSLFISMTRFTGSESLKSMNMFK
uniref:NADH dehydrogenase subunit 4L n=1 Tax=Laemobothrion maximum TaxID=2337902 RepID=UPI00257FE492